MEEGEGEYCLESGQVLLEHVTCLGGRNRHLGSLSQLQLRMAWTDQGTWARWPLAGVPVQMRSGARGPLGLA